MHHTRSITDSRRESVAKRIVMIDDHASYTEGLAEAFTVADDLEVVGREATAAGGVDVALEIQPDLVLCDYRMPGGRTGIDCAAQLRSNGFSGEIVILTGYAAPHVHADAALLDNVRVISKDLPLGELIESVSAVHLAETSAPVTSKKSDEDILNEMAIAESRTEDSQRNTKRRIIGVATVVVATLTAGFVLISALSQATSPADFGLERPFVMIDGNSGAVRITMQVDGTATESFIPVNLPVTIAVDADADAPSTDVQVVVENLDASGSANCSIGVNNETLVSENAQARATAVCAATIN